jgi:hypothetical protein
MVSHTLYDCFAKSKLLGEGDRLNGVIFYYGQTDFLFADQTEQTGEGIYLLLTFDNPFAISDITH